MIADPLLFRLTAGDDPDINRRIAALFRDGFDTFDIARLMEAEESIVANRLAVIRDTGR